MSMIPAPMQYVRVSLDRQEMDWMEAGKAIRTWPVSTARNGPGERNGSGCTPRGWHCIRARIGAGMPPGTVFVGRRPTGEIHDAELAARFPDRDWIVSRILWLGGLEPGFNRYGEVDTAKRHIYIHGSPDHGVTGIPASHGCIRMKSRDVEELFDLAAVGMRVWIGDV